MESEESYPTPSPFSFLADNKNEPTFKENVNKMLAKYGFSYMTGGFIASGGSKPSLSLQEAIVGRNMPAIEMEFNRALEHIQKSQKNQFRLHVTFLNLYAKFILQTKVYKCPPNKTFRASGR